MFDSLIEIDKNILIFLNNLGSERFDSLWLMITKQSSWIVFFAWLGYLIYKQNGWKNLLLVIVFIALLLTVGNETVEASKLFFERLRPCNDPSINTLIRVVKESKSFSFFSGHATNSISTMVFIYLLLKKHYRHAYLVFLYPLIFAYSRIYLGVHFPSDILIGYVFGSLLGYGFFLGFEKMKAQYNFV
jgi:undecaprenyl-diphosphatase